MIKENLERKLWNKDLPMLKSSLKLIDDVSGIPFNKIPKKFKGLDITSSINGIPTKKIHGKTFRKLNYESNLFKKYWTKIIQYIF